MQRALGKRDFIVAINARQTKVSFRRRVKVMLHEKIRNDGFLGQHSVAMLEQCCNYSRQRRNNVATLYFAKNWD